MSDEPRGLALKIPVGRAVQIGDTTVWVKDVTGRAAHLVIDAPRNVPISRTRPDTEPVWIDPGDQHGHTPND